MSKCITLWNKLLPTKRNLQAHGSDSFARIAQVLGKMLGIPHDNGPPRRGRMQDGSPSLHSISCRAPPTPQKERPGSDGGHGDGVTLWEFKRRRGLGCHARSSGRPASSRRESRVHSVGIVVTGGIRR